MSTNPQDRPANALPLELLQATVKRLQPSWQVAAEDFQYLEGGYTNANYRFRYKTEHFVLRTPVRPQPTQRQTKTAAEEQNNVTGLVAEMQFRAQMRRHDVLPIAPLIAADLTRGEMITGFVDGLLLADRPPAAEHAASYLRHLHSQLVDVSSSSHYNLAQLVRRWLPEPPLWLDTYLQQSNDLQLLAQGPQQCCHNDLNPWNVIMSSAQPNRWTTLDWETTKLAHPVFDAVTLHQGLAVERAATTLEVALDVATQDWPSLTEFCTEALAQPVSTTLLTAALRSYWLREYAWADAQIHQGNHNPAIAVQHRLAQQQLQMHL